MKVVVFEFKAPTDFEIEEAQIKLNFVFPNEYTSFIKSGNDLGDSILETLEISNQESYVDIFTVISDARKYYDLPIELLSICENNFDNYCLKRQGEIVFWSHNGATDEKWKNLDDWRNQMIIEASQ